MLPQQLGMKVRKIIETNPDLYTLQTAYINPAAVKSLGIKVEELSDFGLSLSETETETDKGTDAARAVSPDGLQGSLRNLRFFLVTLVDSSTSTATDTKIGGD